MQTPRRPVSFIATAQPDAARAFYHEVLGLSLREETPYALVFDDGGTPLRVQKVASLSPASHTVHGWLVDGIEDDMRTLCAKGVAFTVFEGMAQSEDGIWTSPDGHKIAWMTDPCGNILSLTQMAEA